MNTGIGPASIRVPYPTVLAVALVVLVASFLTASAGAAMIENQPLMLGILPTIGLQNTTVHNHNGMTMVLDRSGSMDDDSYCTNSSWACDSESACISGTCRGIWLDQPISDAIEAGKTFVDLNDPSLTKIGVVTYGSDATLDVGLTASYVHVKDAIDRQNAAGCTNGSTAMFRARGELLGPRAVPDAIRIMVLLTDGNPNVPYCGDCRSNCPQAKDAMRLEASVAASNNIEIYAIGLGTNVDMGPMNDLAALTGGQSYFAPTSSDLEGVYQEIFNALHLKLSA